MNEIKVRCWNKAQNIMCYDNEDNSAEYWDGIHSSDVGMINHCFKNNKYIYMLFTGSEDKNGKGVYVGDIIKNHTPAGENHSAYDEIGEVIMDKNRIIAKIKRHGLYFPIIEGRSEIIGNIYESPEMLEVKT